MAERVSWFLVEPGWSVADSSGAEVGEVSSVIGDQEVDIFDGLHVRSTDGDERYVPGTLVGPIEEGRVTIAAAFGDMAPVPAAEEPGGATQ
jgi:hypothetical protein